MSTDWTAGPWANQHLDGREITQANDRWNYIAHVYGRSGEAETDATANLIVAAPDLHDALSQVRAMCIPGMNWTDEIGQALLALADAALAKARGET